MPSFEQIAPYLTGEAPLTDDVIDQLLSTGFKDVELTSLIIDVPTVANAMAASGFMPELDRTISRKRGAIAAALLHECQRQHITYASPTIAPQPIQAETSGVLRFLEDRPENLHYTELIDRVYVNVERNEAPDEHYVSELRKRYGRHFVRNPKTNKFDPTASKSLIAQVGTNTPPDSWNGINTETIDAVLARRIYADPFTYQGIYELGNMWLDLTDDDRAMIIYIREVKGTQLDPVNTHTQLTTNPRSQWWIKENNEWQNLKQKTDPKSIMTVAGVMSKLYYTEGGQPGRATPFR